MGVPITFMDKYNPEQFEILMMANGNARTNADPRILDFVGYVPNDGDKGGLASLTENLFTLVFLSVTNIQNSRRRCSSNAY